MMTTSSYEQPIRPKVSLSACVVAWSLLVATPFASCGGSMAGPASEGTMPGPNDASSETAEAATDAGVNDAPREINVITGEPDRCTTADGAPGISVDVFPHPNVQVVCEPLHQPGAEDPACPSDGFFRCGLEDCSQVETMAGCCRPDGFCGLLETGYWGKDLALGCIAKDSWIENMRWLGHTVTAMRCGG